MAFSPPHMDPPCDTRAILGMQRGLQMKRIMLTTLLGLLPAVMPIFAGTIYTYTGNAIYSWLPERFVSISFDLATPLPPSPIYDTVESCGCYWSPSITTYGLFLSNYGN